MDPSPKDDGAAHPRPTGAPVFERGRALLKHLAAVNARSLPYEERLRVLLDAGARTQVILHDLAKVYEGSPQPMGEHSREALALARSLAFTCGRGYRVAADQAIAGSNAASRNEAPLILAAMRCIGDAMRGSYRSYSRLPEGAWKEMHDLYLQAERLGIVDVPADSHAGISVGAHYRESLLVSLTDPYRLMPGELEAIEALIRDLRAPVTLTRDRPATRRTCHFLVDCGEDRPPRPLGDGEPVAAGTTLRVLDTSAIVEALGAISAPVAGWPDGDERGHLAAKLAALWDDPPRRAQHRDEVEGSVAICVGVKPIASFVAHDTGADGERETSALREGLTMPLQSLPEDESGTLVPIHEWAVINVSPGGVRVRRSASTAYPITIGEVVGIRAPGRVQWRIGVTRWITGLPDGATEFGVQYFANAVCAVWLKQAIPNSVRKLALLVAQGESSSDELILAPGGTFVDGAEFELLGEGFRSRVRAVKLVEGNVRFELFRVLGC
ncbi:MAG TPA: hypothetical protein VLS49_16375 [Usitatibacter sp.]|nr:hypothetical protein [Usitatibacter sp.]